MNPFVDRLKKTRANGKIKAVTGSDYEQNIRTMKRFAQDTCSIYLDARWTVDVKSLQENIGNREDGKFNTVIICNITDIDGWQQAVSGMNGSDQDIFVVLPYQKELIDSLPEEFMVMNSDE